MPMRSSLGVEAIGPALRHAIAEALVGSQDSMVERAKDRPNSALTAATTSDGSSKLATYSMIKAFTAGGSLAMRVPQTRECPEQYGEVQFTTATPFTTSSANDLP
jgi:hypothetical protein